MQYMLLLNETDDDFAARMDPSRTESYWGGWSAYIQMMAAAGVIVSGSGLMPPAMATTIRQNAAGRQVHDGPFADSKEQLGGYFIIEVADLDAAIDWASRAPSAATASVEIRPLLPPMAGPQA